MGFLCNIYGHAALEILLYNEWEAWTWSAVNAFPWNLLGRAIDNSEGEMTGGRIIFMALGLGIRVQCAFTKRGAV
jgi:hypothetical protein